MNFQGSQGRTCRICNARPACRLRLLRASQEPLLEPLLDPLVAPRTKHTGDMIELRKLLEVASRLRHNTRSWSFLVRKWNKAHIQHRMSHLYMLLPSLSSSSSLSSLPLVRTHHTRNMIELRKLLEVASRLRHNTRSWGRLVLFPVRKWNKAHIQHRMSHLHMLHLPCCSVCVPPSSPRGSDRARHSTHCTFQMMSYR